MKHNILRQGGLYDENHNSRWSRRLHHDHYETNNEVRIKENIFKSKGA